MSLDATELDALRARLEASIEQSAKELAYEQKHGNEYSHAVAETHHSTLMYCVETYIDPLWSALGEARAAAAEKVGVR